MPLKCVETQHADYEKKHVCLRFTLDGKPAGSVIIRKDSTTAGGHLLERLDVSKDVIGQGIGGRIIETVKEKYPGTIRLRARPFGHKSLSRDKLKKFYRSHGFKDESITEDKMILKRAAEDFAPGLPDRSRFGRTEDIPLNTLLRFVLQKHDAERAGLHTDVRLGPDTGHHYSWATKKPFPQPGERPTMLFQQPLHRATYSDFEGTLPSGYGKGTVSKARDARVIVLHATPEKIKFVTTDKGSPEYYSLIRMNYGPKTTSTVRQKHTQGGSWLMVNTTPVSAEKFVGLDPNKMKKIKYKLIPAAEVDKVFKDGHIIQSKIDGASMLYRLLKDRIEATSYRTDNTGAPIVHTHRIFGPSGLKADIPEDLVGTVLRGETYGVKGNKAIPPQTLGGLLNSSVYNSLDKQRAGGIQLRNMLFDVAGEQDKPYAERLAKLQRIAELLPKDRFHLPESAQTPEEARALWQRISTGQHPLTQEGIISWPLAGGAPYKVKVTPEADVWVRGIVPGAGKFSGTHAGGFSYANSPDPTASIVGNIGTGFDDATRAEMVKNPTAYLGRMARIRSMGKFPSGAHRAPSFIALHEDYPAVPEISSQT